jgi:Glutathione S-transferase, N-terminal domain
MGSVGSGTCTSREGRKACTRIGCDRLGQGLARGAEGRHDGAVIKVYSYRWVPSVVRGVVRDVRVRWALEEIGLPYENVLIGPAEQKSDEYRAIQPFGQVPALVEDDLTLSESGAIVHYLAQKSEKLMPKEPVAQARVTSWMFAALNSVEPFVQHWQLDVFFAKEDAKTAPKPRLRARGLEARRPGPEARGPRISRRPIHSRARGNQLACRAHSRPVGGAIALAATPHRPSSASAGP